MLRRLIVPFIVLTLGCAACSSSTVISEATLDDPQDAVGTDESTESSGSPEPTDSADGSGSDSAETVGESDQPASDSRGGRNLTTGDQAAESEPSDSEPSDPEPSDSSDPADSEDPQDSSGTDTGDLGFGLGGDRQVESLLRDCVDGSDLACDILFPISAVGSTEEQSASLCGGRSDAAVVFCTDGIEADSVNGWFIDSSPGLDAVVTSCDGGDMTACDFLYFRSALDSEYEEIGNTCGGRTVVALPDCRTAFPDNG